MNSFIHKNGIIKAKDEKLLLFFLLTWNQLLIVLIYSVKQQETAYLKDMIFDNLINIKK